MTYELLQLAISNLLRARARLLMTAGGVLVGTTAIILLIALTIGLQEAAESGFGSDASLTELEVYPPWDYRPSPEGEEAEVPKLDVRTVATMWQIPGVVAVIPTVGLQGGQLMAGEYMGGGWIQGIDPALLPYMSIQAAQGELRLNPGEIIVGAAVGDNFYDTQSEYWEPIQVDVMQEQLTLQLYQWGGNTPRERNIRLTVSAVLAPGPNDYAVFMRMDDVIRYNEWINNQPIDPETFVYERVVVRTVDRNQTNDVRDAIRAMGLNTGGMGDFLDSLNSFFTTMRLMLGGVGGIALLVSAFGVANTMTMAILERTKEIGLMKAIGATDSNVLTIFLIEAGLVGLAGGVAGVSLSMLLQRAINQAIANISQDGGGYFFLPVDPSQIGDRLIVIPPELMMFALLLATGVGIGAGLYPALRAANMPPVNALKSE